MKWPPAMHTQYVTPLLNSHGISIGELEVVAEHTAPTLPAELRSSYSRLLELGLRRLIALHPSQAILVIELLAGEDSVIFAKELSLLPGYTYAVKDVAAPIKPMTMYEYSHLHWNLRVKDGN